MAVSRPPGSTGEGSRRNKRAFPIRLLLVDSDAARLSQALKKLLAEGAPIELSLQRAAGSKSPAGYIRRVAVRQSGGVILFLPVEQIDWIEANNQYVRLHVGDKRHLVRESIVHLESRLDPANFRRIHRSTIVNLDRVRELHATSQAQRWVVLVNGDRLQVSQAHWAEIHEALVGLG